eukprot:2856220-Amphidinium_carterae.1
MTYEIRSLDPHMHYKNLASRQEKVRARRMHCLTGAPAAPASGTREVATSCGKLADLLMHPCLCNRAAKSFTITRPNNNSNNYNNSIYPRLSARPQFQDHLRPRQV